MIAEAFRPSGIDPQRSSIATGSIHLQTALLASGPFLVVIPGSVLRFSKNLPPLKVLPVDLPMRVEYGGCKSWVEFEDPIHTDGAQPVLTDQEFETRLQFFRGALEPATVP